MSNENDGSLDSPLLETPPMGVSSIASSQSSAAIQRPRILDREGRFSQSRGRWSVANTERGVRYRRPRELVPLPTIPTTISQPSPAPKPTGLLKSIQNRLFPCSNRPTNSKDSVRSCWDDWFHTISYTPTFLLLGIIFFAYFATIVLFAGMYYGVNKLGLYYGHGVDGEGVINEGNGVPGTDVVPNDGVPPSYNINFAVEGEQVDSFCGMDVNNFMEALYFSLSTMATIGYGTSDYYFGNCWTPFFLVLLQVFSALAFSSLAIGLLFQRMSRGQKRGRTIIFSDVAVIRKVRGHWYWMFRVAELRKRHIIGAKVRVFCVRHERCPIDEDEKEKSETVELETAFFVSHPLSILGGSKDTPSSMGSASSGLASESMSDSAYEQSILMGLPHVVVHRMDQTSAMMPPRPIWYDEKGLAHSPSSFGDDAKDKKESTSLLATMEEGSSKTPSQEEIQLFLQDRHSEIIVFLEGTCEITGMQLQARHSYRVEDIVFNHTFATCVFPGSSHHDASQKKWWNPDNKSNKKAKVEDCSAVTEEMDSMHQAQSAALEVDFGQFHELVPAPLDCISCPYVPSSVRS